MAGKRVVTIDMLKGLLIIYVVMYHLFSWNIILYLALVLLLASGMLMFFCISGYTYSVGKYSWGKSVLARIKQLIIPMVLYEIAIYIINCIILILMGNCTITECLSGIGNSLTNQVWRNDITSLITQDSTITFRDPSSVFSLTTAPFWFIFTMFFADLIFFAVAKVVKLGKVKTILTIIGLVLVTILIKLFIADNNLPFCLQDIPAIAAIMLLGLFLKENNIFKERRLKGVKFALTIIGGYIICLVIFVTCGVPQSIGVGVWGKLGAVSVISALVLTVIQLYMQLGLCDVMSKVAWLRNGLKYIGGNTLSILFLHCFLGTWIKHFMGLTVDMSFNYTMGETILSLLVVVGVIAICCLYQKLLDTIKTKRR